MIIIIIYHLCRAEYQLNVLVPVIWIPSVPRKGASSPQWYPRCTIEPAPPPPYICLSPLHPHTYTLYMHMLSSLGNKYNQGNMHAYNNTYVLK